MTKKPNDDDLRDSAWLLRLGLGLTAIWVAGQLYYLFGVAGFQHFLDEGPSAVGGFLEGAFAPLAFLWLVIGFFLQREELQRSSRAIHLQYEEMRRTAEQAELQARAIAANERHARQDAFLRVSMRIDQQLDTICGLLVLSSQTIDAGGNLDTTATQAMWSALGTGDRAVFARALMGAHFRGDRERDTWTLFWSTSIRTRHSERFMALFERLLARAHDCDSEGLLVESLNGSTHGLVYSLMQETRSSAPPVRESAATGAS